MNDRSTVWKLSVHHLAILVGAIILLTIGSYDALRFMVEQWSTSQEYGYGFIIPFLALFFVWQKSDQISKVPFTGSWAGVLLLLLGLALMVLGDLAAVCISGPAGPRNWYRERSLFLEGARLIPIGKRVHKEGEFEIMSIDEWIEDANISWKKMISTKPKSCAR